MENRSSSHSLNIARQVPEDLIVDSKHLYDAMHSEVGLTPPENGYDLPEKVASTQDQVDASTKNNTLEESMPENPYFRTPKSALVDGILSGSLDEQLVEEFMSRKTLRIPELADMIKKVNGNDETVNIVLRKLGYELGRLSNNDISDLFDSGMLDATSKIIVIGALGLKNNAVEHKPEDPSSSSDVSNAITTEEEKNSQVKINLPGLHPDSNWHAEDDSEQREITHDEQADVHSPEEPSSEIPQATASQLPDVLPAKSEWFDDTARLSEAGMSPDAPVRRQIPEHLLERSRKARQRHEQALLDEATRQTDAVVDTPHVSDTVDPSDSEAGEDEPSLGKGILSIWEKFIDSRKDMKVLEENKGELFDLASNTISQALTEKNPFPDLDRDEILSVFDVLRPYLLSIFTDVVTGATGQQTVLSMNEGSVNYIFNKIMNLSKEEFPELDQTSPEDDTIAGKFDDSDDDTIASGNFIANNTNTDEDDVVVASFISDTNGVATNADKPTAPTTGIEADPPVPSPSIVDKKLGSLVTRKTILNPVKIKTTVAAWKDGQASASTEPTLARNIGVRVGRSRAIRAITNVLDKPLSANELESLTEYEQKQAEIQSKKYEDEAKRDSNIKPKRNTQTEEPKSDDKKESKPLEATVVASKEISVDEFLRGLDDDERNEVSKLPYSTLQKLANASTK
jgi:hypothetical protein